jgi:hypothetical protein
MRSRTTIKWMGLALVGLLVAVGVAIAAANLAGRQIGLASEPISAGDALAPAASPNGGHGSQSPGGGHGDSTTPTAPTTTPEPQPTVPPPTPDPETTTPATPEAEPTSPTSPPNSADDHGGGNHGADD